MSNLMIAKPDITSKELSERLGMNDSYIRGVKTSSSFEQFHNDNLALATSIPTKNEALAAAAKGITYSWSKGQLEDKARVAIMDALGDTSTIKDSNGNEIPVISKMDKARLGVEVMRIFHAKSSKLINQKNTMIVNNSSGQPVNEVDPVLSDILNAVLSSIPMKEKKQIGKQGEEITSLEWSEVEDEDGTRDNGSNGSAGESPQEPEGADGDEGEIGET